MIKLGTFDAQDNDFKSTDGIVSLPDREKWDRSSLKTLWTEMESTLDSGSYWILQGMLMILLLIGKLLLLISHDIPPSAKCYPPVAGILASGEILKISGIFGWHGIGIRGVVYGVMSSS